MEDAPYGGFDSRQQGGPCVKLCLEKSRIVEMTEEYAKDISKWKYEGAYSFYDHNEGNAEGYRDGAHFACMDPVAGLIGYFCYGCEAQIPTLEENVYGVGYLDVGLGMRPDLCGLGHGLPFIGVGLDYARERFNTDSFRLSVAAFNERAVKVYVRAGFQTEREVTNSYYKNKFYIMRRTRG